MYRRLPVILVSAAAAFSLVACGSDSPSGDAAESTPTTSAPSTPESSSEAGSSPASSSAAAGAAKPVTVNKTITDPEFGHKAVVTAYVDGFPASAAAKQKYAILQGRKVVLVKVTVTAGTKYRGEVSPSEFRLTGTSNDVDLSTNSVIDDELKAAGYTPLEDVEPGQTGTGWIAYFAPEDYSKIVFRYQRLAYQTTDGKSIARQEFDVPLN